METQIDVSKCDSVERAACRALLYTPVVLNVSSKCYSDVAVSPIVRICVGYFRKTQNLLHLQGMIYYKEAHVVNT